MQRSSRSASMSSPSMAMGTSFRLSSVRECSRRARNRMARTRSDVSLFTVRDAQAMRKARRKLRRSVAFGCFCRLWHPARDADRRADLLLDLLGHRGIFLEELARVVLALADLLTLVRVPGAGLLDDAVVHAH